jgi:hypothetical protein
VAAPPEGGDVHVLTGGAGAVWWALEEPGTVDALVDDLAVSFGVAADGLATDVRVCLEDLVAMGLVEHES